MADVAVKPEIKVDPATSTPMNLDQIEAFEDDHDLHIPPVPPAGPTSWLVKVPKYIWEAWADIYKNAPDDGAVEIGKMRVYKQPPGQDDPLKQEIQIRLAKGVAQHVELPKTYDLSMKTNGFSNTVVFSEKDLPGHRSQPFGTRNRMRDLKSRNSGGIQPKSERYGQTKPGTYRSAIPKQTALAPLIQHEADAAPVQDEHYYAHFNKLYQASVQPKKRTAMRASIDYGSNTTALNAFSTFSSTAFPRSSNRKRAPKEKAVRISENALLDALYQCFQRYRYWSLKALRNELKQPETFIKQVLEQIAVLVRSGDFAMNYMLKEGFENAGGIKGEEVKEETAVVKSEAEESEMEMSDGDEDLEDFEDVKMEG